MEWGRWKRRERIAISIRTEFLEPSRFDWKTLRLFIFSFCCITHCNFVSLYVRNCISEYQFGIVWVESVWCSFIHYHCEMDERRNEEKIKRKAESVQLRVWQECASQYHFGYFERCNHFVNGHTALCLGLFSYWIVYVHYSRCWV